MPADKPRSKLANVPGHTQAAAAHRNVFHPSSFIIRVVDNITGAAILTSQLVTAPRPNGQPFVDNLSFGTFLTLVSEQVGFNVQGRIRAVVPRFHAIAPIDSLVELRSEVTWRAVLQVWQNTRRKTCEFVVEAQVADA
ncbi:hypothetical protein CC86DRAFT_365710 [Ophiobolus disseminans]|uniref:Thioesterase domain-containing protein n=1 Tax=Ophiobolus disseminans TaxID=1469910 RepID=A0A6A7AL21_9PLEO|nr:hypothetical protein CC86DRAFT_365710 [Ophiobolus disseminans]